MITVNIFCDIIYTIHIEYVFYVMYDDMYRIASYRIESCELTATTATTKINTNREKLKSVSI